jgi:hypothetical protein
MLMAAIGGLVIGHMDLVAGSLTATTVGGPVGSHAGAVAS